MGLPNWRSTPTLLRRRRHHCKMTDINITADELKEYLKDFKKFDKDGSGMLEKPEIFKALEELLGHEPDEEAFEDFMQEADTDQNGQIDFKEFMCVVLSDSEWTVEGQEYGAKTKKKAQPEEEKEEQEADEAEEEQEDDEAEEEQEDDEAEHDDAYWEKKQLQDDAAFEAKERKKEEEEAEKERKQEEADEAADRKGEEDEEAWEREAEEEETKRKKDQVAGDKAAKANFEGDKAADAKREEEWAEHVAALIVRSNEERPDGVDENAGQYRERTQAVEADAWDARYAQEAMGNWGSEFDGQGGNW